MKNSQLGFTKITLAFILVAGAVLAGLIFYLIPEGETTDVNVGVGKDWLAKTYIDQGISFKYPEKLNLEYYNFVNDSERFWPPKTVVKDGIFSCTPGTNTKDQVSTEIRTVNDKKYCMTRSNEAGMSQLWNEYSYTFSLNSSKIITLSFTVHSTNGCGVYDDGTETNLKFTQCEKERTLFTQEYVDSIVDGIFRTIKML